MAKIGLISSDQPKILNTQSHFIDIKIHFADKKCCWSNFTLCRWKRSKIFQLDEVYSVIDDTELEITFCKIIYVTSK